MAFVPDAAPAASRFVPDAPPAAAPEHPVVSALKGVGNAVLGELENEGARIGSIPHSVSHAVSDLAGKISGGNINLPEIPAMQPGQAGREVSAAMANNPIVKTLSGASDRADAALQNTSPVAHDLVHNAGDVANDVSALESVRQAGGAARGAFGDVGPTTSADASAQANGFRTSRDSPVAATVAGSSGKDALVLHNRDIGNTLASSAANVPHGTPLNYDTLEAGRSLPNQVYGRVAAQLPEAPLSPAAQSQIQNAGGVGERITSGSPDAANGINTLKGELLAPGATFDGNRIVNEMRGLRQEGYVNVGSEDVSKQQLGKAQLDMARGLEQHVNDTLPKNSDVSMDQLKQARTALAQNHAVQAALKGPDVDMQAIGRIQRADPDLLSGPLKDIADFANASPEVSSLPSASARYSPPSLLHDAASFDIMHPVGSAVRALGGGPIARRVLTGGSAAAVEGARQRYPSGSLADMLAPIDHTPQAPDLTTGIGANPSPAAAGGRPGDIPLADLLSHGVEQSPSAGLSVAPMGVPHASGVPFVAHPEAFGGHELSLADEFAPAAPGGSQSGLAHVMSEGVPEGGMTKTGKRRFVGDTVDFPGGVERRRIVDLLTEK